MKKIIIISSLLLIILGIAGCESDSSKETGDFKIYAINGEGTELVSEKYLLETADIETQVTKVVEKLQTNPENVDYLRAIPEDVDIISYSLANKQITVSFSDQYSEMSAAREVLCRAAIVKTIAQIDGVENVSFNVLDAPLTDSQGNIIGVMTGDMFVESSNEQMASIQTATISVFFANEEGNELITEVQKVHYSTNMSKEKLVIQQLLAGPTTNGAKRTISEDTKLLSASIRDGVCYVDFDKGFLEKTDGISEEVKIYSVVNSLSDIQTVSQVQISVEGKTDIDMDNQINLSSMFTRNLDLVAD